MTVPPAASHPRNRAEWELRMTPARAKSVVGPLGLSALVDPSQDTVRSPRAHAATVG